MTFTQTISLYVTLNALVVAGYLGLLAFNYVATKLYGKISAARELKLHYLVLTLILAQTALLPLFPTPNVFAPPAKVWSAPSIHDINESRFDHKSSGYLAVPGSPVVKAEKVATVWRMISFVVVIIGATVLLRDILRLLTIQKSSFVIRRMGRVRVLLNNEAKMPFSFWLSGRANIIIPTELIQHDLKIILAHEIQHHRQGDTRWVYVLWVLKLLCLFNPAFHFWNRWIMEIQEFACDETLVGRKKVESRKYARCLVEVAQNAIHRNRVPVCATGFTFLMKRNLLKRRIKNMLDTKTHHESRGLFITAVVLFALFMGTVAFASKGLVQDRRVTMEQAQAMAARAAQNSDVPVIVNEMVVKQLNRFIGTPEGREYMREALHRMREHKALIEAALARYNAPVELMAIPIVESGYRNLPPRESAPPIKSAGMWQFIPETARKFGLVVNEETDERMDIPLATDAAVRYLLSNYLLFKDWHLSMLSYNMGESAVARAIKIVGAKDAWSLIRNGHEGDKDYLPKVMAAIIIMRNPESVE